MSKLKCNKWSIRELKHSKIKVILTCSLSVRWFLVGLGQLRASTSLWLASQPCTTVLLLALLTRVVLHHHNHLLIVGVIVNWVANRVPMITATAPSRVLYLFFLHLLHFLSRSFNLWKSIARFPLLVRMHMHHFLLRWLRYWLQSGISFAL